MRPTPSLERAFSQLLTPSTSRNICGSCRLRGHIAQRRQLQTSAAQNAGLNLRERLGFAGKKDGSGTAETDLVETQQDADRRANEYSKGWSKPRSADLIPEGWPKTPEEDSQYIIATKAEDLEHVGNPQWVDAQYDDKGKYKGWARVKKGSKMSPEQVQRELLEAAKAVVSPEHHSQLEQQKTAFQVSDPAIKFALVRELRARISIQVPDVVMNRAHTLRDFLHAIITKPKAKKLSFDLLANEKLAESTNVMVRGRRQTPIHKDRAVGRWKLIEQELANRGLPITGHGAKAQRGFEE